MRAPVESRGCFHPARVVAPYSGRAHPRTADPCLGAGSQGVSRVGVRCEDPDMTNYLISFPSFAMVIPEGEFEQVVHDSHAVIEEAKAAGVYVFGGGLNVEVAPVLVAAD